MVSILVPVYNFDVRDLIKDLSDQAVRENIAFEIIVLDDASHNDFKIINCECISIKGVQYLEEKKNLGRSKIRNKLAEMAKFNYLLFLDCDSKVIRKDFLLKYLHTVNDDVVLYGGSEYELINEDNSRYRLHYLHGINREQIPAGERDILPHKSFKTNNFMITKRAFHKVKFNETIKGYGHEDTLFGYDLAERNIMVRHIDNPVIHLGLESNEEFLRKTREGIKNLKRIVTLNGNAKKLTRDITLLTYYKHVKSFGLTGIFRYIYSKNEYRLRKNLLGKTPSLFIFDLYKLGYLCSLNGEYK